MKSNLPGEVENGWACPTKSKVPLLGAALRRVAALGVILGAAAGALPSWQPVPSVVEPCRCRKQPMSSVTPWTARAGKSGKECGTNSVAMAAVLPLVGVNLRRPSSSEVLASDACDACETGFAACVRTLPVHVLRTCRGGCRLMARTLALQTLRVATSRSRPRWRQLTSSRALAQLGTRKSPLVYKCAGAKASCGASPEQAFPRLVYPLLMKDARQGRRRAAHAAVRATVGRFSRAAQRRLELVDNFSFAVSVEKKRAQSLDILQHLLACRPS